MVFFVFFSLFFSDNQLDFHNTEGRKGKRWMREYQRLISINKVKLILLWLCTLMCKSFSFATVFTFLTSISVLYVLFLDAYIIKLFDRSVDLAQFNTSTPLYPICRAWMKNNPSVRESITSPGSPPGMTEEEVGQSDYVSNNNLFLWEKLTNLFVIQHCNII